MEILITGASGFIGSHIAEKAIEKGYSVRAFIRPTSSKRWLLHLPLRYYYGDLIEKETISPAVEGVDYLIHCAGLVKGKGENYEKINLIGTKNLLEVLIEKKVPLKKFVYLSTVAVSGPSFGTPKKETSSCEPITEYGKTKYFAEKLLLENAWKLNILILRPGVIYGPRDKETLPYFRFLKKGIAPILGGRFPLMFVEDLTEAILFLLRKETPSGDILFLSNGKCYTFGDIAETFERITGIKNWQIRIPYFILYLYAFFQEAFFRNPVLMRNRLKELTSPFLCSSAKLASLGFLPQSDLTSGMKKTIAWYEKEGWL